MANAYPPDPTVVNGQKITVDRLANNPVVVQRLLRTLVQQRLIGDKLLRGRIDLTGSGSLVYEIAESIFTDFSSERVAALMEYPLTTAQPGTVATASTDKWALATELSDEAIARNRLDIAVRNLTKLANRLAFGFDQLVLSAVGSAVTQTQPVSSSWTGATPNQFLDILLAVAQADVLNQGYVIDTIALKPVPFARLISSTPVLAALPREGNGNPVLTGNLAEFAGLTFVKSTNLPPSVDAMVLDSTQLGSIAFEELGGGYQGSAAQGLESKTYRKEGNDGVRIQGRIVRVPVVQEPGAAVKLTGTLQ